MAEDSQKVAAIGAVQRFDMPKFTISPAQDDPLGASSKFVGVWSSKRGWANGKGRNTMVIITEVSATGMARGYYLWGPPTKHSWTRDAAGHKWFAEYIVNDKFSIKTVPEINVKLDNKNVLTLLTAKSDKPAIGQHRASSSLATGKWRGDAEPSAKRDQAPKNGPVPKQEPSERRSAISGPTIKPKVAQESDQRQGKVAGQSMEDRYRACRKLVKGFAQRDACARNGGI